MEENLLQKISENPTATEKYLECSFGRNQTCTEIWGEESFDAALQWAYTMEDDTEVESGSTLTEEYYETRLPVVKDRLMAAGVRLAATLESIFHPTTTMTTPSLSILTMLRVGFAM
jgi:hypothetical protein